MSAVVRLAPIEKVSPPEPPVRVTVPAMMSPTDTLPVAALASTVARAVAVLAAMLVRSYIT